MMLSLTIQSHKNGRLKLIGIKRMTQNIQIEGPVIKKRIKKKHDAIRNTI